MHGLFIINILIIRNRPHDLGSVNWPFIGSMIRLHSCVRAWAASRSRTSKDFCYGEWGEQWGRILWSIVGPWPKANEGLLSQTGGICDDMLRGHKFAGVVTNVSDQKPGRIIRWSLHLPCCLAALIVFMEASVVAPVQGQTIKPCLTTKKNKENHNWEFLQSLHGRSVLELIVM